LAQLLIRNGADIEAKDNTKATPLHAAVYEGNIEVTKLLIQEGADLKHRADYKSNVLRQKRQQQDDRENPQNLFARMSTELV
jgi:ankyrin repeat protein